jgi:hypothetical protein
LTWTRPVVELPPAADYALKVRHTVKAGWEQWFLFVTDCHWDSPECYLRILHSHFKQAKERNALIVDGGDFFDAISGRDDKRASKGSHREEHNKVNYLDVLVDSAVDEFRPYLDNIIYMGTGNHEQAVTIKKETDLTARFIEKANALRTKGLPPIYRAGYTGWIRMMFENANKSNRSSHAVKIEHGTGGNSPVTRGIINTNRRQARTEGASFFVSGHIHESFDLNAPVETLNSSTGRVILRQVKHLQCASYKMDFRLDGVGTWAQMKIGQPKPIGGKWLRFFSPDGGKVRYEVHDTWVDYENLTDQLRKSRVVVELDEVA